MGGNGYAFLAAHQCTRAAAHLHRARQFARAAVDPTVRAEYFGREDSEALGNDTLFGGNAGAVCFALDAANPEQAWFPAFMLPQRS